MDKLLPSGTNWTHAAFFVTGMALPLAWIFATQRRHNNQDDEYDDDSDDEDDQGNATTGNAAQWSMRDAPFKMVLIVNQELTMGKGKIAAQCAHAAVGCFKKAKKDCPATVSAWERTGCAKIALKCPTEAEMKQVLVRALAKKIPCYLVEDAGKTQIAAGSRTVLGLGPAPESVFDGVSDHLKLL